MLDGVITFLQLMQILAAGIGFLIALYIFRKKSSGQKLVCPIGAKCDAVVHSPFSKFLGFPVELMGLMYYGLIILGYAGFIVVPAMYQPEILFVLFLLTIAGFMFSLYLTFIQVFTLREFCTWCLTSAVMSSVIFIIGIYTINTHQGGLYGFLELVRPGITIAHVLGTAIGLGAATISDIFFFNFLKDFKISHKENEVLHKLSQVIWLGLGLIILAGLGLYLPRMAIYNMSAKFLLKMIIVLIIVVNGAILNLFVSPLLTSISFGKQHHHHRGELTFVRRVAFALGAVSFTSWYTVFILGSIRSIPVDLITGFGIYAAIVLCAIIASQFLERVFSRKGAQYYETGGVEDADE